MAIDFSPKRGSTPTAAANAGTGTTPAGAQTPAPNGGQPGQAATPTGATATPAGQPFRSFTDQRELDAFVQGSKSQAERAAVRKLAKDMGFEDADEMREALQGLRQAQGGTVPMPAATATPSAPGTSGSVFAPPGADQVAARLQTALKVAAELNLPVALIARLQGASEEEMKADAQALLAVMGGSAAPRAPGIPAVPATGQQITFTRTQLQDPKFVRDNAAAIRKAHAEGRIVNS